MTSDDIVGRLERDLDSFSKMADKCRKGDMPNSFVAYAHRVDYIKALLCDIRKGRL